jgi:hypothetical protein
LVIGKALAGHTMAELGTRDDVGGLFDPTGREVIEMLYEFEQPFVVRFRSRTA